MATIQENITSYLETPKGQRDREYNKILQTYLALLENGTITENDPNSELGKQIDAFIASLSSPSSAKSQELLQKLKEGLDDYVAAHFNDLKGLGTAEVIQKLEGLKTFLIAEKKLSSDDAYNQTADDVIKRIDEIIAFLNKEKDEDQRPPLDSFFEKIDDMYLRAIQKQERTDVLPLLVEQLKSFHELRKAYEEEKADVIERYKTERCEMSQDVICDFDDVSEEDTWGDIGTLYLGRLSPLQDSPRLMEKRDEIEALDGMTADEIREKYDGYSLPESFGPINLSLDDLTNLGDHTKTIDDLFKDKEFITLLQARKGYKGLSVPKMKVKFVNDLMLKSEEVIRQNVIDLEAQLGDGGSEIVLLQGTPQEKRIVFENTDERDKQIAALMLFYDGILLDPNSRVDAIISWFSSIADSGLDVYTIIGSIYEFDNLLVGGLVSLAGIWNLYYFMRNKPIASTGAGFSTLRAGFVTEKGEKTSTVENTFWKGITDLDKLDSNSPEYKAKVDELTKLIKGDFDLADRLEIFEYYIQRSDINTAKEIRRMRKTFLLLAKDEHFYTTIYRRLETSRFMKGLISVSNKTMLSFFEARAHAKGGTIDFLHIRQAVSGKNYHESYKDFFLDKVRSSSLEDLIASPLISPENKKKFRAIIQEIIDDPRKTLDRALFSSMKAQLAEIEAATNTGGMLQGFRDEFSHHVDRIFELYIDGKIPLTGNAKDNTGLNNLVEELKNEKDDILKIYNDKGRLPAKVRKLFAEIPEAKLDESIRKIVVSGIENVQDGGAIMSDLTKAITNYVSPRTKVTDVDFVRTITDLEGRSAELLKDVSDGRGTGFDTPDEAGDTEAKPGRIKRFFSWIQEKNPLAKGGPETGDGTEIKEEKPNKPTKAGTEWIAENPREARAFELAQWYVRNTGDGLTPERQKVLDDLATSDVTKDEFYKTLSDFSGRTIKRSLSEVEFDTLVKENAVDIFTRFVQELELDDPEHFSTISDDLSRVELDILEGKYDLRDIDAFETKIGQDIAEIADYDPAEMDKALTPNELLEDYLKDNRSSLSKTEISFIEKILSGEKVTFGPESKWRSTDWFRYLSRAARG